MSFDDSTPWAVVLVIIQLWFWHKEKKSRPRKLCFNILLLHCSRLIDGFCWGCTLDFFSVAWAHVVLQLKPQGHSQEDILQLCHWNSGDSTQLGTAHTLWVSEGHKYSQTDIQIYTVRHYRGWLHSFILGNIIFIIRGRSDTAGSGVKQPDPSACVKLCGGAV